VPLPTSRPLTESDLDRVRFDTALRGYRMAQVDQALRRAAYDIGYKDELIGVLEAEVVALRAGRTADADALRQIRDAALVSTDPRATGRDGREDREVADVAPDSRGEDVRPAERTTSADGAGGAVRSEPA